MPIYADSPEPSLLANAINTKISIAGLIITFTFLLLQSSRSGNQKKTMVACLGVFLFMYAPCLFTRVPLPLVDKDWSMVYYFCIF